MAAKLFIRWNFLRRDHAALSQCRGRTWRENVGRFFKKFWHHSQCFRIGTDGVTEAVKSTAHILTQAGALETPVQVISNSGDGGALAIGLRSLLHTIYRRTRITIIVLVNEFFANTGFQYSPASSFGSDTSTTPVGMDGIGNHEVLSNYLHLTVAAGAGFVAQVSPAHSKVFFRPWRRRLNAKRLR